MKIVKFLVTNDSILSDDIRQVDLSRLEEKEREVLLRKALQSIPPENKPKK